MLNKAEIKKEYYTHKEIDDLIAIKIMGWHKYRDPIWDGASVWEDEEGDWHGTVEDFKPSENMNDAWEVAKKLKMSVAPQISNNTVHWCASIEGYSSSAVTNKLAEVSICLSALEYVDISAKIEESDISKLFRGV